MSRTVRILLVGDVVGEPGRRAVARTAARLRAAGEVEAVIANAENSAGGRGITPALAGELFAAGVDVVTLGDHAWDQKEIIPWIAGEPRLLRPANLPPGCPGRGWTTVETAGGPVTVINLLGRVFMPVHPDCPFRAADAALSSLPPNHGPVIVDLHAEATSEKIALGWHLDGRVSAVVGTHTHVQTSDETVLPKGTAYLTDLGMTGPKQSVLGRDVQSVLRKFLTTMPGRFEIASGDVVLEGAVVEILRASGRAVGIRRLREPI